MSNMSYCRFVNTVQDMEDCYDALLDGEEISESEKTYAVRLLELCADFLESEKRGEFGQIDA